MKDWTVFDDVELPEWTDDKSGELFCSFLNSYIPKVFSGTGTRYHLLSRYPSGRLYFHLLNRPRGV